MFSYVCVLFLIQDVPSGNPRTFSQEQTPQRSRCHLSNSSSAESGTSFQSPRVIKTSVVWLLLILLSANLYITFVTAPAPIVFEGLWFWDVKRVEWDNPAPENESQLEQYTRNMRKFQTSRDRRICHGHVWQIQRQTQERTKGSDCGPWVQVYCRPEGSDCGPWVQVYCRLETSGHYWKFESRWLFRHDLNEDTVSERWAGKGLVELAPLLPVSSCGFAC